MTKNTHEIRDPVHVFIRLDSHERKVLDSRPFQRLRHIHQLAMTYLLYPGATHRRFEHSLGVMELADRVFKVITNPEYANDHIRNLIPQGEEEKGHWLRVLRMAALCHDIGHLPFSHAAEKELLPEGWNHEQLTRELIMSDEMKTLFLDRETNPVQPEQIVKLALGPKEAKDLTFSDWEVILAEIIVGDAFGVDRMDYLLRDSLHTGVAYGRFDHYRLIDSLRILQTLPEGEETNPDKPEAENSRQVTLGIDEGGLQSAEALMFARYSMYSQVYLHPVRRIYDIHLKDFLKAWLKNSQFPIEIEEHLAYTDNEVTAEIRKAAKDESHPAYIHAQRIIERRHFKVAYQRNPSDVKINRDAGKSIYRALCAEFGEDKIRLDWYPQKGGAPNFPVRMRDGRPESSLELSKIMQNVPIVAVDYVFADREIHKRAEAWVRQERQELIQLQPVPEEK